MTAKLYPGIAFSPVAELTDNVGAGDTIIPVSNVEAFPPAPNLATIGTDEEGETILYAAKTAAALSGCTRGVEGTARAWSSGEPIARNWTAKDHDDLIAAVGEAAEAAQNTQDALAEHQADDAAHGELFAAKQPKLTGQPGQVVGFDGMGLAYAVPGWSNPNLLDNWYFVDPVNQRGQTEYTTDAYTIDRWKAYKASVELTADGLKMTVTAPYGRITQDIDRPGLTNQVLTFSVLYSGLTSGNLRLYYGPGDHSIVNTDETLGLISGTFVLPADATKVDNVFIALESKDASVNLIATKLELGTQQTLAHQDADGNWVLNDPPPNKELELLKCQKYFKRIKANNIMVPAVGYCPTNNLAVVPIQLSVPLRTNPTIRYSDLNDVTIRVSGVTDLIPTKITPYYTLGQQFIYGYFELAGNAPVGGAAILRIANSGYLDFDANL